MLVKKTNKIANKTNGKQTINTKSALIAHTPSKSLLQYYRYIQQSLCVCVESNGILDISSVKPQTNHKTRPHSQTGAFLLKYQPSQRASLPGQSAGAGPRGSSGQTGSAPIPPAADGPAGDRVPHCDWLPGSLAPTDITARGSPCFGVFRCAGIAASRGRSVRPSLGLGVFAGSGDSALGPGRPSWRHG